MLTHFVINGMEIPQIESVRFLGIILVDCKLSDTKHLKHLIKKGQYSVAKIITSLAGTQWSVLAFWFHFIALSLQKFDRIRRPNI